MGRRTQPSAGRTAAGPPSETPRITTPHKKTPIHPHDLPQASYRARKPYERHKDEPQAGPQAGRATERSVLPWEKRAQLPRVERRRRRATQGTIRWRAGTSSKGGTSEEEKGIGHDLLAGSISQGCAEYIAAACAHLGR